MEGTGIKMSGGVDLVATEDAGAQQEDMAPRLPEPKTLDAILSVLVGGDDSTSSAPNITSTGDPDDIGAGEGGTDAAMDLGIKERQRTALKKLILGVQDKLLPPKVAARRAQGASLGQGLQQENCMFLKVTVVEARALVGELADERTTSSALQNFAVDLQFNGQRARTRNEVRCCVDPKFGEEVFAFVLREAHELPVTAGAWASFLQTDLPLHVVLIKENASRSAQSQPSQVVNDRSLPVATKRELVGTAEVDWRRALVPASGAQEGLHKSGGVFLAVELASAAPDSIVHPVGGILHLRLEVVAPREVSSFPFAAADVTRIMGLQVSVRNEARRDFYLYADGWWKSFTSVSKDLRNRPVKIFAEDERGQHRCVCSFLQPQRQGRLLPTPRHAARFVSLLPFQRRPSVGEQRLQSWNSPHAFLSAGRGDASDHALLLCSLLLGFGLDALVCIGRVVQPSEAEGEGERGGGRIDGQESGSAEETSHFWVCTFSGARSDKKAFFWETLTGQRFSMLEPRPNKGAQGFRKPAKVVSVAPHHFTKISCMFNHHEFFANKQANERVGRTSLDISDVKLWKPMESSRIFFPENCADRALLVLLRPVVDSESVAEGVELDLKRRIGASRENKGLSTVWDDELGFLLGPAVFAYEQERVSGASFGGGDFQDAIQGAVPDRHSFKGYPTCFDHCYGGKMMASLLANVVSNDILASTGDHLRFALRSMVFPYPDGVLAVWLMLACRFEAPADT